MNKETYERLELNVTEFDAEDVIATSEPGSNYTLPFVPFGT